MLDALLDNIKSSKAAIIPKISPTIDDIVITDLVEHVANIDGLDDFLTNNVMSELESLNLKSSSRKVMTKWLSPTSKSYNYGNVVNNPIPIDGLPNICQLLSIINRHPSTTHDLDACLVTRFSSAKCSLSLHKDNEELMSPDSSICTVTFGAPRELEFVMDGKFDKGKKDLSADFSFPATNRTMNIMKPGAQLVMKHRVKQGKSISGSSNVRYSLSFRKIAQPTEELSHDDTSTASPSQNIKKVPPKKNITLIAGDSFAARLDAGKLGKGKQDVRNIAKGGSRISAVQQSLEDFNSSNPTLNVKNLFISIGANDIRYCKDGIKHLKNAICDLMKSINKLFPTAKVYVQSLIPYLHNSPNYRVGRDNIMRMNNLLFDLCSRFKLFYLDVFPAFLGARDYRNEKLFPAFDSDKKSYDIHPNARGKGVLASFYIYYIHSKRFNPVGF